MESLRDIAAADGIKSGSDQGQGQDQQQAPSGEQQAPVIDRRQVLEKPCALAWGGGCGLAAWLSEVDQLAASDPEKEIAGQHLANILDAIMPDDWLRDLDPNSKAGRILVSGAVLAVMIRQKSEIYDRVMAEREAAEREKSESDKAE